MNLTTRIMENTHAYRLWQAPFAEKKFAPILAHNDLSQVRRVLDVGCGPGTNTPYFTHARYLGIDHNLRYLEYARQRYRQDFLVADIARWAVAPRARFDFALVTVCSTTSTPPAPVESSCNSASSSPTMGTSTSLTWCYPKGPRWPGF